MTNDIQTIVFPTFFWDDEDDNDVDNDDIY